MQTNWANFHSEGKKHRLVGTQIPIPIIFLNSRKEKVGDEQLHRHKNAVIFHSLNTKFNCLVISFRLEHE